MIGKEFADALGISTFAMWAAIVGVGGAVVFGAITYWRSKGRERTEDAAVNRDDLAEREGAEGVQDAARKHLDQPTTGDMETLRRRWAARERRQRVRKPPGEGGSAT